eukprot:817-Pelagococcus_subviridis.AAC.4
MICNENERRYGKVRGSLPRVRDLRVSVLLHGFRVRRSVHQRRRPHRVREHVMRLPRPGGHAVGRERGVRVRRRRRRLGASVFGGGFAIPPSARLEPFQVAHVFHMLRQRPLRDGLAAVDQDCPFLGLLEQLHRPLKRGPDEQRPSPVLARHRPGVAPQVQRPQVSSRDPAVKLDVLERLHRAHHLRARDARALGRRARVRVRLVPRPDRVLPRVGGGVGGGAGEVGVGEKRHERVAGEFQHQPAWS